MEDKKLPTSTAVYFQLKICNKNISDWREIVQQGMFNDKERQLISM